MTFQGHSRSSQTKGSDRPNTVYYEYPVTVSNFHHFQDISTYL